jgi:hypothetical protein
MDTYCTILNVGEGRRVRSPESQLRLDAHEERRLGRLGAGKKIAEFIGKRVVTVLNLVRVRSLRTRLFCFGESRNGDGDGWMDGDVI